MVLKEMYKRNGLSEETDEEEAAEEEPAGANESSLAANEMDDAGPSRRDVIGEENVEGLKALEAGLRAAGASSSDFRLIISFDN